MKENDVLLCPLFSIADTPKTITATEKEILLFEIVKINEQYFLKYTVDKSDLKYNYALMFLKFKFHCTGLSVATSGHFWVQDVLLDESLRPIWERKNVLHLEIDKEIERSGPKPLQVKDYMLGGDITAWISINYPRVFNYHHIGLSLLRSSLSTEYLYADVLLNFFKIVELVTFTRVNRKPDLRTILRESKKLNILSLDESQMREFYIMRGRDSAHDWDKVRDITRKHSVECKIWSEELIIRDMMDRHKVSQHPSPIFVHDSPNEAKLTFLPTKIAKST